MAFFSSLSVMPCIMVIGTPYVLIWMRVGAAGWDPGVSSSSSSRPCYYTHAWKKSPECYRSAILFVCSPRSGRLKGVAGAEFSNVAGVGRGNIVFNLEPPVAIPDTLFADIGGAQNSFFLGMFCAAVDL